MTMTHPSKIERIKSLLKRRVVAPAIPMDWEEVFQSLEDGLIILSEDLSPGALPEVRVLRMNPGAEKLTGVSLDMVAGLTLAEAFPKNQDTVQKISDLLSETRSKTMREIEWRGAYGESLVVDLLLSPLLSESVPGRGWVLLLRDITPLKKLEDEMRKSDRLATCNTVIAGLAHEIKNPLGGIKGAAQLVSRKNVSPDMRECLDIIIKEVTRVDHLLTELLTLSRPGRLQTQSLNINELLNEILVLQERVLREGDITLVREFDPSLPPLQGDVERLTQALLNFMKNAIAALEGKAGRRVLKVRTRFQTDFRIRGLRGNKGYRMILVEISDNGCGIPREDLNKIFIPFFTTKESGTGLGMAIAQGIIYAHQGTLRITSEVKKGTTVSIHLRTAL